MSCSGLAVSSTRSAALPLQFLVQGDTREVVRVQEARIGAGDDRHAGFLQQRQHCGHLVVLRVARLDLRGRGLGGAIHAPLVGGTQARADVGQVRVVGVVILVEEVEDAATVEGRGHEHATPGEIAVGVHRGLAVEARVEPPVGFGTVDAAGAEVGCNLRLVLAAGLERIVQVLDRSQPGIDGLLHGQRHRDMAGRLETRLACGTGRVQEQLRLQRAVGDLHEIDLVLLQAGDRLVDVRLAAHFDRALPDRLDAFDLRARTEQARPEKGRRSSHARW
ncbi:hypothetical protein G6F57_017572 [Rhizopus arrhizus]|nr:hypothetical protein G6F57_017572 [Rhizopus arrhizus]